MEFPAPRTRAPLVAAGLCVAACLAVLAVCSLFVVPPRLAYRLDADALVVDARLGWLDQGRVIARATVQDPRPVRLERSQRLVGTAVRGYCQGRFRVAELGTVWLATSCGAEGVALDTPNGVVVVSPADRDGFLGALARGESGAFPPAPPPSGGIATGWLLLLAGLAVPLPWIAWRLSRPLVYRIEGGALVVPGVLRPVEVALPGARVRREPLRKAWRIGGAALPGLYVGWFRAQGGTVHVAATSLRDGVMVEGSRRVYVTPEDIDGFVAALERAGAVTGPGASAPPHGR